MIAIKNKLITVRTSSRVILAEDNFLDFLVELPHLLKVNACVKKNQFDKRYLDTLYVWRPDSVCPSWDEARQVW